MVYFYISPTGTGDGSSYASPSNLPAARAFITTYRALGSITIMCRGGIYPLTTYGAFNLTTEGSGIAGCMIYWRSCIGEKPIFSGGYRIPSNAWSLHDGVNNIYKTTLPQSWDTRQFYVNDQYAIRSFRDMVPTVVSNGASFTITDPTIPEFSRPQDLELFCRCWSFILDMVRMDSATRVGDVTTLVSNAAYSRLASTTGQVWVNPERLENALELLTIDTPGCWYLNYDSRTMYYVPRIGEDPTTLDAFIPLLINLVKTTPSSPVSNVEFIGISFQHTTWLQPTYDHVFIDVGQNWHRGWPWTEHERFQPPAAIHIESAHHIFFKRCTTTHVGGQGVLFHFGAKDCGYDGGTINDTASSGMTIGQNTVLNPAFALQTSRISARSNKIFDTGTGYKGACGIKKIFTDNCKILYNEIWGIPYSGIALGDGWLEDGAPYSNNNEIGYNHIHHVLQYVDDGAGVYTLTSDIDTHVHHNYVHDSDGRTWYDACLYADEESRCYIFEHNVCERAAPLRWFYANSSLWDDMDTWNTPWDWWTQPPVEVLDNFYTEGAIISYPSDYRPNVSFITLRNTALIGADKSAWPIAAQDIIKAANPQLLLVETPVNDSTIAYGWRSPSETVEVTAPVGSTIGEVLYPAEDSWMAVISGLEGGTHEISAVTSGGTSQAVDVLIVISVDATLGTSSSTSTVAPLTATFSANVTATLSPSISTSIVFPLPAEYTQTGGRIRDGTGRVCLMYFWNGSQFNEFTFK